MRLKTIIFVLSFLILLAGLNTKSALGLDVFPISNLEITVLGSNVILDSPLVKFNNKIYFPIRDFLTYFEGSFSYSRKNNFYTFSFPKLNITTIIIPNSKEILINNENHFFKNMAIEYEQQLYVPLEEFCAFIGYAVEQKNSLIEIKNHKDKSSKKDKKRDFKYALEKDKKQLIDLNRKLPFFESDREQYLSFGDDRIYQISNEFFYDNEDILYLNLDKILIAEGFKINFSETEMIVKYKERIAKFSLNDNLMVVNDAESTANYTTISPVMTLKKEHYLPLLSFLKAFNYSFTWSPKNRVFSLIKELSQIKVAEKDEYLKFHFTVLDPQDFTISTNENNTSIQLEFPNTTSVVNDNNLYNDDTLLKDLNISNQDSNTLINLDFKAPIGYESEVLPGGLNIIIKPIIIVYYQKKSQTLNLESLKKIDYQTEKTGNKLIIDLNRACKINFDHKPNEVIKDIVMQKTKDNYRLTVTLQKNFKYNIVADNDKNIRVIFSQEKKIEPIPRATIKQANNTDIIIIDAGHGGLDSGALTPDGRQEKEFTLDIVKLVKQHLEKAHKKVILTREEDKDLTLQERVYIGNNADATLFVSVHLNSYTNSYANGTETYYFKPEDKALADILQAEMLSALGLRNNGVRHARLFVNRFTTIPSTLVEPLYLSNEREYNMLKEPEFKEKIAKAIADGILKYLEKE